MREFLPGEPWKGQKRVSLRGLDKQRHGFAMTSVSDDPR